MCTAAVHVDTGLKNKKIHTPLACSLLLEVSHMLMGAAAYCMLISTQLV